MNKYKQCELKNKDKVEISWIPIEFARTDKILKIKINNLWDNGWIVTKVFDTIMDEKILLIDNRTHKEWREVTDI